MSEHWKDEQGCTNWLLPDGDVRPAPPKNFGVIGNGHLIKLGDRPGEETPWDENFEREFERADDAFPALIKWLAELPRRQRHDADTLRERFLPVAADDVQLTTITECVVSLAVRSPMNRQAAVAVAEHYRGPLPEQERNSLIGLNMRRTQRSVADKIRHNAKFAVVYSPDRELIFGDGFFSNIRSPGIDGLLSPRVLAPITPRIGIIVARPTSFSVEPRISTLMATAAEASALNEAVQVYAANALFYRAEKPEVIHAFRLAQHLVFRDHRNPADTLIDGIPGMPERNTFLHGIFG